MKLDDLAFAAQAHPMLYAAIIFASIVAFGFYMVGAEEKRWKT